ncbi:uncharacterized protein LOC142162289 [Nicotiana tabacum]|uniref:Uncharacterized protein LOC142162289 n=1 Tax=Nicotiana tabacum TaxID=4097 RepID=A0AC58RPT9_TOBAC
MRSILHTEKLFIGGDFNGHIGASAIGYDDVHGGYGFGVRNEGVNSLLDFARALIWKCDKGLCIDYKVIPSEHLTTLHRLLVVDLEIKRGRRKRAGCRQPKIKWGNLTKDKA